MLEQHWTGEGEEGMGAGVEAIECKKCKFPRRKDYKHVCERAYGHGRRAGPAPTTVRTSRTELRHAIGYSGELLEQRWKRITPTHVLPGF